MPAFPPRPVAVTNNEQLTTNNCYPPASYRNASIGSIEAARRAGYTADSTAMPPNNPQASAPVFQVGNKPAKKSGIGSRLTSAQMPYAIASPVPPLTTAISTASRKN